MGEEWGRSVRGIGSALGWLAILAILAAPLALYWSRWRHGGAGMDASIVLGKAISAARSVLEKRGDKPLRLANPMVPGSDVSTSPRSLPPNSSTLKLPSDTLSLKGEGRVVLQMGKAGSSAPQAAGRTGSPDRGSVERGARVVFATKTGRDPMLSPSENQALKAEQERRRLEAMGFNSSAPKRRPRRASGMGGIHLQGIVEGAGKASAIINNEIYAEGDRVLGAKLIQIRGDRVVLEYKGKRFVKSIKLH